MIFKLSQCCRSNEDPKPELLGTEINLYLLVKSFKDILKLQSD